MRNLVSGYIGGMSFLKCLSVFEDTELRGSFRDPHMRNL